MIKPSPLRQARAAWLQGSSPQQSQPLGLIMRADLIYDSSESLSEFAAHGPVMPCVRVIAPHQRESRREEKEFIQNVLCMGLNPVALW